MLNNHSLKIAGFIVSALIGLVLLIFRLNSLNFEEDSIKMYFIILFSLIYLMTILIIILFLKVYETKKKTKEIKREEET